MDQKRSNSPDCPLKESPTSKNVSKSRAFQIFPTHTCISVLGVAIAHFFFCKQSQTPSRTIEKERKISIPAPKKFKHDPKNYFDFIYLVPRVCKNFNLSKFNL
uniref:Transmembrane protein n=1 Tax=Cacopsylla melanoneura TaxID=428564 RepID=A0A8D8Z6X0_9HEMI